VENDTAVKCHFYIGEAKIISLDAIVGMDGLVPYYDTKSHQLESYFTRMWNALFEIKKEYFRAPYLFINNNNIDLLKHLISLGSSVKIKFKNCFKLDDYFALRFNREYTPDYKITACNKTTVTCSHGQNNIIKISFDELIDFVRFQQTLKQLVV